MLSTTAQSDALQKLLSHKFSQEFDHYPVILTHTETTPTGNFFSTRKTLQYISCTKYLSFRNTIQCREKGYNRKSENMNFIIKYQEMAEQKYFVLPN